jgi:cellulose biosynthesis protein BcsQ
MKTVSLFNHKGGVSKTTTVFNLGWAIAEKGYKVLLVDADPQCNLTTMSLSFKKDIGIESIFEHSNKRNIRDGLSPAFESKPELIQPIEAYPFESNPNLFLLPGHIKFSEYELTLGMAQELSGSLHFMKNIPGSLNFLIAETARSIDASFVLIDLSPSLSSINQNLLMSSNYFIVPCFPDIFSEMAIESLSNILPKWSHWARKITAEKTLEGATYPFEYKETKFLGTIIQKYNINKGLPTTDFQVKIEQIVNVTKELFIPALEKSEMLLANRSFYTKDYILQMIPDFHGLIAKSQEYRKPPYALSDEEIGYRGIVKEQTEERQIKYKTLFDSIVKKLVEVS